MQSMMNGSDWLSGEGDYQPPPAGPPPMPDDVQLLEGIAAGLQLYYTPVLTMPGLLGNILCVVIIGQQPKANSGHVYSMALVLVEALQLLVLLHDWAAEMGTDLYQIAGWCHLITLLRKAAEFLCQWYLVCVMADCYVTSCAAVRNVNQSTSGSGWRTAWRARLVTGATAVLALVVFLNISLTYHVYEINSQSICHLQGQYRSIFYHLDVMNVVVNVIIPCVIIISIIVRLVVKHTCQANSDDRPSSYLLYGIMHSVIWLPLQLLQVVLMVQKLIAPATHVSQFRAMFWTKTISYISYTNMALNIVILLLLNPTLRHTVTTRLKMASVCCQGRQYYGHHVVGNTNGAQHSTAIEVVSPSDDEADS